MIIRREDGRLRLMLQTDHARLVAQFAAAWGGGGFCAAEPLGVLMLAAEIHDEGWLDWEQEPRLNPATGRPYDFLTLPPDQHVQIYERGIQMALEQHPYAGLLVSLHGTGLHRRRHGYMPHLEYRETDPIYKPVVDRFVARQQRLQAALMQDLQPQPEALWTHYRWLQAWDLLSVVIGLRSPLEDRTTSLGRLPLYPGGPEQELTMQTAGPTAYCIDPWPFTPSRLELVLSVRYLPDRAYCNEQEFRQIFEGAPTQSLGIQLVPR